MKHMVLKTVNAEGKAYGDFLWPTEGPVEPDVWNPTPKCGDGLHGLLDGRGDLSLLDWWPDTRYVIFEIDDFVDLKGKIKAPRGTVVHHGDREGALQILADKAGLQSVREWVCQDQQWACYYAIHVDQRPRDDTREVACGDPKWAFKYALYVDKCSRDDTRAAACGDPKWAYEYAVRVDKCARDDTRAAACEKSKWAYMYAHYVDGNPRDDTREAACQGSCWAYLYAHYVDKCARDDTRAAACQEPEWASQYSVWEKNLGFLV